LGDIFLVWKNTITNSFINWANIIKLISSPDGQTIIKARITILMSPYFPMLFLPEQSPFPFWKIWCSLLRNMLNLPFYPGPLSTLACRNTITVGSLTTFPLSWKTML
jgi:hypothetical protein